MGRFADFLLKGHRGLVAPLLDDILSKVSWLNFLGFLTKRVFMTRFGWHKKSVRGGY